MPPIGGDGQDIEGNLLVPFGGHHRRQNGLFTINVFRADGIRCNKEKCGKEVEAKCRHMYVKVHFAGKTAKTKVCKKKVTPSWNEGLNFIEAIPSLFQTISIEVWDKRQGIQVGTTSLSLNKLWNQTDVGVLPTFGPSFMYLFQQNKKKPDIMSLSGRILISLTCRLIDRGNPVKLLKITRIPPFLEFKFPPYENFTLFLAIFQCIFFNKKYFNKCIIKLHHGSIFHAPIGTRKEEMIPEHHEEGLQNDSLFISLENPKRICKPYFSWSSYNSVPAAQTTSSWPSTNDRERRNNHIKHLMRGLGKQVHECQRVHHLGEEEDALRRSRQILEHLKHACSKIMDFPSYRFETNFDLAKKVELRELLRKIKDEVDNFLDNTLLSSTATVEKVQEYIFSILEHTEDPQKTFPDFEIAIERKDKNKKITQVVLKSEDYLYSAVKEESGSHCGKVKTIFVRNGAREEVAAIDAFLWFGKRRDLNKCLQLLRGENNQKTEDLRHLEKVTLQEEHRFELRVHIYNARLNPGSDASGLADPFVRVFAFGQTRESQVKAQTLDPFWDETLLFSHISLFGERELIKIQSTGIVFEILDYDGKNVTELVGVGVVRPQVKLLGDRNKATRLKRETVYSYGEETAEILMAMELIEVVREKDEHRPNKPPSQYKLFNIPDEIRPHFKRHLLEVVFWGIRNYKNLGFPTAPRIMALLECNGVRVESSLAKVQNSLNFEYCVHKMEIFIPAEKDYAPPLSACLYEFNCFNRAFYKGGTMLPSVTRFLVKTKIPKSNVSEEANHLNYHITWDLGDHSEGTDHVVELDETPDWWTKYYASKNCHRHTKTLQIYNVELEKQPGFEGFQDFLFSFDLRKGKTDLRASMSSQQLVANLKCGIRLHPCPESIVDISSVAGTLGSYPPPDSLDVTIRVYVVAAYNLTPTDINGRCDPYIALSFGKIKMSDRNSYIYKDTNPTFGKCYELKGAFPWDHTLRIRVMDHDICQSDDLIGQTFIDLEKRYYTKHRASCGLSDCYDTSGYCQWRDLLEPTEILAQICKQNQIDEPQFLSENLLIGRYSIPYHGEKKEKVALNVLRNFQAFPDYGFPLVPEHVETRSLFHPKKPDIEQGKLEMWVDIFPGHSSLPPAIDITPRQPQALELRMTVWNTAEVLPADTSLLTRQKSSDIYVKAWLTSDQIQKTDIHYRSLTGEGNFNWRFIFSFLYSPAEHKIILWKKVAFSGKLWKEKIPCTLEVQVWDNDLLSDDFIGSLTLNLWDMPKGAKSVKECTLKMLEPSFPKISVFKYKKARGWWPFW